VFCIDKFLNFFAGAIHECPAIRAPVAGLCYGLHHIQTSSHNSDTRQCDAYAPVCGEQVEMLPDWQTIDLQPTWQAFWQSCNALKNKPGWQPVCVHAQ